MSAIGVQDGKRQRGAGGEVRQSIATYTSANNCSKIIYVKQSRVQGQNNLLHNEADNHEQLDSMKMTPSDAAKHPPPNNVRKAVDKSYTQTQVHEDWGK